jgi:hypothetical protein
MRLAFRYLVVAALSAAATYAALPRKSASEPGLSTALASAPQEAFAPEPGRGSSAIQPPAAAPDSRWPLREHTG